MIRTRTLMLTLTLSAAALSLAACTAAPGPVPERHTVYVSDDAFAVVEARLRAGIDARPLTLFTVVDHGEGARSAGMSIGESKLFLVGNPQVGTPFMQADPQLGLDLPLKILIHDAPDGTHLAYSHPGEAAQRHGVREQLGAQVDAIHDTMGGLLGDAAGDTVRTIDDPASTP